MSVEQLLQIWYSLVITIFNIQQIKDDDHHSPYVNFIAFTIQIATSIKKTFFKNVKRCRDGSTKKY